jgi:hypothetical protein
MYEQTIRQLRRSDQICLSGNFLGGSAATFYEEKQKKVGSRLLTVSEAVGAVVVGLLAEGGGVIGPGVCVRKQQPRIESATKSVKSRPPRRWLQGQQQVFPKNVRQHKSCGSAVQAAWLHTENLRAHPHAQIVHEMTPT